MKTQTYVIRHPDEECPCTHCGCPLFVGNRVHLIADGQGTDDRPHCSAHCCRRTRIRDAQLYAIRTATH